MLQVYDVADVGSTTLVQDVPLDPLRFIVSGGVLRDLGVGVQHVPALGHLALGLETLLNRVRVI